MKLGTNVTNKLSIDVKKSDVTSSWRHILTMTSKKSDIFQMTIVLFLVDVWRWLTPCLKDNRWNFLINIIKLCLGPFIFADVSTFLTSKSKMTSRDVTSSDFLKTLSECSFLYYLTSVQVWSKSDVPNGNYGYLRS